MNINFRHGTWLNEPKRWSVDSHHLTMTTDAATDFWRETYYGFTRDSGHFLGVDTADSFTAKIRVRGEFCTLYDQAGLMLRINDATWVKAGVEFTDGALFMSTVVTVGSSDWSVSQPFPVLDDFFIRITVKNGALRVQASSDGRHWPLLRLATFPAAPRYQVGPMACTPERSGLSVVFSDFWVGAALDTDLHDQS